MFYKQAALPEGTDPDERTPKTVNQDSTIVSLETIQVLLLITNKVFILVILYFYLHFQFLLSKSRSCHHATSPLPFLLTFKI
jgi:hypothetical protein